MIDSEHVIDMLNSTISTEQNKEIEFRRCSLISTSPLQLSVALPVLPSNIFENTEQNTEVNTE